MANKSLWFAVTAMALLSSPAWSQSYPFNSDSPRERQIEQSGTGVGLATQALPLGLQVPTTTPRIGTTIGTTTGTTTGSTIGTPIGTSLGSTTGQ